MARCWLHHFHNHRTSPGHVQSITLRINVSFNFLLAEHWWNMHNEIVHGEHLSPKPDSQPTSDIERAQSNILYNHFTSPIRSKLHADIVYTPLRMNNAAHIILCTVTQQCGLRMRNAITKLRGVPNIEEYIPFLNCFFIYFLHTKQCQEYLVYIPFHTREHNHRATATLRSRTDTQPQQNLLATRVPVSAEQSSS
jgi:hypothetical protein